jgi:hypothetical protein
MLLALLAASVGLFLFTEHVSGSQVYFLLFGYSAGVLLSAIVIQELAPQLAANPARRAALKGAGAAFVATIAAVSVAVISGGQLPRGVILGVYAALALCVLGLAYRISRPIGGRAAVQLYGLLLGAALGAAAFDAPLDAWGAPAIAGEDTFQQAAPPAARGITPGLAEGLKWIRDNTDSDAVLAVNVQDDDRTGSARYFYYSAFAERRVFLGGWGYSDTAYEDSGNHPYAEREALNAAIFRSDCGTLSSALEQTGVDYVLHDHFNVSETDPFESLAVPEVREEGMTIYSADGLAKECGERTTRLHADRKSRPRAHANRA